MFFKLIHRLRIKTKLMYMLLNYRKWYCVVEKLYLRRKKCAEIELKNQNKICAFDIENTITIVLQVRNWSKKIKNKCFVGHKNNIS